MSGQAAHVEVLTAEVRTLMVGRRQVTLSVYKQLDTVEPHKMEPFGRVRTGKQEGPIVELVGRRIDGGDLVRADHEPPASPHFWNRDPVELPDALADNWCVVGPTKAHGQERYVAPNGTLVSWQEWLKFPREVGGAAPERRYVMPDGTVYKENELADPRPTAGRLAERGEYRAWWPISRSAPLDMSVAPGRWRYASDEVRATAEALAARDLDMVFAAREAFERSKALPLIVLAGLR